MPSTGDQAIMSGMADIFEWPTEIVLKLEKDSSDKLLTCWLCGRLDCDMTTTLRLGGERRTIGLHAVCVKGMK